MKRTIKSLLTITLAILLVFSCIGCKNSNTESKELDQWDYFQEWGRYSLYTLDETHKDYNWGQGWGVITDTVYTDYLLKSRVGLDFTKEDLSPTIVRNIYELVIPPTLRVGEIILKSFSIDVGSLVNDRIEFNLYIGTTFIKTVEVNTIAGDLVTLESGYIGDLKWETGSKQALFLRLKAPNLVEPYTLKNLKMNIERK